jgi:ubiquinone/menaquinone biosynthesis C-methylase UbiE
MNQTLQTEQAVRNRYTNASQESEAALCCPVEYDPKYLKVIPSEVIEKDYGCGDPSRYLRKGEVVLDLGSGTGKICFIASQVVGPEGRVIGVDMTDSMIEVARRNAPVVADHMGYANVEFRKGRIQDLGLDLERLDQELRRRPMRDVQSFLAMDEMVRELRLKHPLIETESIDVVVSNCVLNLVESKLKPELFKEIFRVLRIGGRAVISDIVSDEEIPGTLQNDPELWSGCISGALTEKQFLEAFEDAGFYGIQILKLDVKPWRTVQGIEFRSVTLQALKGKQGPCIEKNQAVIYRGPFKEVLDDDGHRMKRGLRYAVCDKTYQLYKKEPYRESFEFIDPVDSIPAGREMPFNCARTSLRHPRETKGMDYNVTTDASQCCDGGNGC